MDDLAPLLAALSDRRAALRGLGYRIRFDLTDLDRSVLLDGTTEGGGAAAECPPATEADAALALSSENAGKLIAGKLSPMLAFSTGRLKVEGSRGVALKLASLLDED